MRALTVIALLLLAVVGCDNTVTPLADGSDSVFAVYGYLDTAADTQFVRISGLTPTTLDVPASIPESVTLTSGGSESVVLEDSTIVLDDGSPGVLYFAAMRPEPGESYALEAAASGGGATTARVTVPRIPPVSVRPAEGDSLVLIQKMVISGVQSTPQELSIAYDVIDTSNNELRTVSISYGTGGRQTPSGWDFDVFLTRDRKTVALRLGQRGATVQLVATRIEMVLLSPEWSSGGANIDGGHGFFGAVGRHEVGWALSSDEIRLAGFSDAAGAR